MWHRYELGSKHSLSGNESTQDDNDDDDDDDDHNTSNVAETACVPVWIEGGVCDGVRSASGEM